MAFLGALVDEKHSFEGVMHQLGCVETWLTK